MLESIQVIGSTAPLGAALVERLKADGRNITALYRSTDLVPPAWYSDPQITLCQFDLAQIDRPVPSRSDVIVWLAHIEAGRFNQVETDTNIAALDRYLNQIEPAKTRKFVFISSGGSVYGTAAELPIHEGHDRVPMSSYGRAKKALEDRLVEFHRKTGIDIAILRPGNIYGFEHPDRKSKGVINAFLRSIVDGSEFSLIHGGETIRDFVYVDDVCEAILLAIDSDKQEIIWNVATGIGTRTIDVLVETLELSGKKMPSVANTENYTTDVLENVLSIDRIRNETGWSPKTSLTSGLERMLIQWFTAQEEATRAVSLNVRSSPP